MIDQLNPTEPERAWSTNFKLLMQLVTRETLTNPDHCNYEPGEMLNERFLNDYEENPRLRIFVGLEGEGGKPMTYDTPTAKSEQAIQLAHLTLQKLYGIGDEVEHQYHFLTLEGTVVRSSHEEVYNQLLGDDEIAELIELIESHP